jgi:hypothetical protein
MANYPVVPGPRMPYSIDGSVLYSSNGIAVVEYSSVVREATNDEAGEPTAAFTFSGVYPDAVFGVVFPQLRDLTGFFLACSLSCGPVEYSTNTTTGIDGTWNVLRNTVPVLGTFPYYRSSVSVTPVAKIKAIRFRTSNASTGTSTSVYTLHLYGSIVSGQAPASRIAFWHPTIDQALPGSWLDWGDVARATSGTKTFRLRNLSSTQTANNVQLSVVAPTDLSPGAAGAHTFSTDGVTFTSTINISAIGPNSYSPVITIKRSLASNQALSLFAFRAQASVTSWS